MRLAERVTFGGGGLDRAAGLREDTQTLAQLRRDPHARVVPLWRGKPLVRGEAGVSLASVPAGHEVLEHAREPEMFLGLSDGVPWFATDVSAWAAEGQDLSGVGSFVDRSEQHLPGLPDAYRFVDLRMTMTWLAPACAELAATARALCEWHRTHRFCANCGSVSRPSKAGWQRDCPACGRSHFPRTDAVVIMLVTQGNSVLVGRSPGWPEGMYSLLAGFLEPGETVEAAVRREVYEEAGVRIGAVGYLASQPWPFPASLMIGCRAEALGRELEIDPEEIEDARWVTREEMLAVFAQEHPTIWAPRTGAIAHFILAHWLADRLD